MQSTSSVARATVQSNASPITVLVVDDSAVIRGLVKRWLDEEEGISVLATAADGERAIKEAAKCLPDVVVMDIEMPKMDGITALPQLLKVSPDSKVIISSTLTLRNADISLRALALGATDYVAKPTAQTEVHGGGFRRELAEKVRVLGESRRRRPRGDARPVGKADHGAEVRARPEGGLYGNAPITVRKPSVIPPRIIAIGSSTGGPQALVKVLEKLDPRVRQPIIVTQHMPATFTKILAEHLARASGRSCQEAVHGERLQENHIYVAPGGLHMVVALRNEVPTIELNQDPPENFCRPAVDPMYRSVAKVFGGAALGIVLTGMGHDGLAGGQALVAAGGTIIAQDEGTSVVWGMPGAVATGGLCSAVVPLEQIAAKVVELASLGG